MKKVFIFSTLEIAPWGGSEQMWSDAALKLSEMGNKVMTNTMEWPKLQDKLQQIKSNGGMLSFRPNPHVKGSITDKAINKVKNYNWKKAVSSFDPDVILISEGGAFDNAIMQHGNWLLSLNKPVYIMSQFLLEYEYIHTQRRNFFIDYFQKAKKIFFVSNRNKTVAERTIARHIDNAAVIKNPIKIKKTTEKYPDTDIYNIGVVARLESDVKGYDIIVETFAQPQWKDRNYCVNVYGSGPHEDYIKELVAFYGLQDKIIFRGFENDVVNIWDKNHILLLPSRGEGTPLSLLEANYCKRAAVVTDVGGNAEVITEGLNGFVAEAPVLACVSNAMERAWAKREQWEEMGLTAKKNIDHLYQTDAVEELIKEISC